ncbi:preprotein translocase subunit YajC [Desulfoscipio geothermicus]|uniref:Preprotein translocase subunit YajC n=1 Tax=Desulfoscipio geothermicus DSM 3669 TaxID=1121426 RepID=A0A1I6EBH0_9FIRM|nr:preprotein translocase subunit YajC [Desulfoscipio geothermicus]SFR15103.1 preprotein translocase subunit YajC [Desulfoscipio geothermicus DSM 3669]
MTNESLIGILYIVGLFALLWFLMIRPQQQRQKKHAEMVRNLNVNDRVVTVGGIYGTIVKVKDDTFILRVADNVRIEILKNAVSQVISSEAGENNKD